MESIDIFISHSSRDVKLAEGLINLIRAALRLPAQNIRCTSVDGYRLPPGVTTDETIRKEVHNSKILIGIISRASISSLYVSFELGARWGAHKFLIPILAPNVEPNILSGPLSGINSLKSNNRSQLQELIDFLSNKLQIVTERYAVYQTQIDSLINISTEDILSDGPKLLQNL